MGGVEEDLGRGIRVVVGVIIDLDHRADGVQAAQEHLQGVGEPLDKVGEAVLGHSGGGGDGPVRGADQGAPLADGPQPGPEPPGEPLAEGAVLLDVPLSLRPVTARGLSEHLDDEGHEGLGEVDRGQPAPASGERGQGEAGVEAESEVRGLGHNSGLEIDIRTVPVYAAEVVIALKF